MVADAAVGNGRDISGIRPDRQLDHILTDDPGLRVGAASAELMPISDHRALLVDLDRASKTVLI
ncbi:endonuclease/exonuclease/phosphatase domain protein [Mycobacterium kansasii]|uniref:Endonuclease/exonuclease/phosphatase domain protein n=1 Tax=Mycobacterium kansasii TaxID=1768 RepID=A0A1V3X2S2_MYCKA|nr:endonuclease/exonuclease/phosphatase domain protein [Mycobacterium kansasii]